MQDQLVGVFVGIVAEPLIRWLKAKFAPSSPVMLLITVAVAAFGAVVVVGAQILVDPNAEPLSLERLIALAPTVFAVGQVIYALI